MKKILTALLASSLAMTMAFAVSADGWKTGSADDGSKWDVKDGVYTLTEARAVNHDSFNTYVLGDTADEVTVSVEFKVGTRGDIDPNFGGDAGFLFAAEDVDGDGLIKEGADKYYLVELTADGAVGIEKNVCKWGDWNIAKPADNATSAKVGETATLTVTYKAGSFKVAVNGEDICEVTDPEPLTGTGYVLATKQPSGCTYKVTTPTTEEPAPEEPTPEAPTTGSAVVALTGASLIALAGAVIATKKRYF